MYTYIECAGSDVLVVAGINIRSIRVCLPPAKAAGARLSEVVCAELAACVTTFAPLQVPCLPWETHRALIQHWRL